MTTEQGLDDSFADDQLLVLGTAGLPGSGKSKIAELAEEMGFRVIKGGDVVREEARARDMELTDENLAELTETLREEEGDGALAKICIDLIQVEEDSPVLIDSFRNKDEIRVFEEQFGENFHVIAVEAPFRERFDRLQNRSRADDITTREELRIRDTREMEWGVGAVIDDADIFIENAGTLDEFELRVRSELTQLWNGYT